METGKTNEYNKEKLGRDILKEWQGLLDFGAEILHVPAGLITRLDGPEIEILMKSENKNNPYLAGYKSQFPNSGWFCENTLKKKDLLLIPNALKDPNWKDNAAVTGYNMISYAGMPITLPAGGLFGTICFLDNKENAHNELHIKLIGQIKKVLELSLCVIYEKDEVKERDRLFGDLSKIYPICVYCKKVRNPAGEWIPIEKYVDAISGKEASHGICPQCFEKFKTNQD